MESVLGEPALTYQKTSVEAKDYFWPTNEHAFYSNAYIAPKEVLKKQKNLVFFIKETDLSVKVNEKTFRLPAFLKNIAQHIEEAKEILNYSDDWDDEGALATDSRTFEKAASFVIDYAVYVYKHFSTVLSVPYIDILRDGSVSVHWENGENTQLLIIFKKEADDLAYYYAEQSDRKIPFKSAIVPGEPVDETLALWMKNHLG
jgi:hypothetical protein